jgi:hypothetical protein
LYLLVLLILICYHHQVLYIQFKFLNVLNSFTYGGDIHVWGSSGIYYPFWFIIETILIIKLIFKKLFDVIVIYINIIYVDSWISIIFKVKKSQLFNFNNHICTFFIIILNAVIIIIVIFQLFIKINIEFLLIRIFKIIVIFNCLLKLILSLFSIVYYRYFSQCCLLILNFYFYF